MNEHREMRFFVKAFFSVGVDERVDGRVEKVAGVFIFFPRTLMNCCIPSNEALSHHDNSTRAP